MKTLKLTDTPLTPSLFGGDCFDEWIIFYIFALKIVKNIHSILRRALIAASMATVFLLVGFLADSQPYVFGDETSTLKYLHIMDVLCGRGSDEVPPEYLAVNIGYDRRLVDVTDEYGFFQGNIDITDRRKLAAFLIALRHTATYRGIILDVEFDDRLSTEYDLILFAQIDSTERISIAEEGTRIRPGKMAPSSYRTSLNEGNMVKYPFIIDGRASLAAHLRDQLDEDSGRRRLRYPTIVLPLSIRPEDFYDSQGEKTIYNLGADILDVYDESGIGEIARDRIIVIGDYSTNDFHDTYAGAVAGPVIIMNALEAISRGKDRPDPLSMALAWLVYAAVTWCLLFWHAPVSMPRWLAFIFSFLSYSTALLALTAAQWWIFGEFHDQFWVASAFTLFYFLIRDDMALLKKIKSRSMKIKSKVFAALLVAACGSLPAEAAYRIISLNTPSISIGGKTLKKGDVFQATEKIDWSAPRQAMKVMDTESHLQKLIVKEKATSNHWNSVADYIAGERNLSSRDGNLSTIPALRAHLNREFMLMDSISVQTGLPTDSDRFFFVSYTHEGEVINKQIDNTDGRFTITPAIFSIDGSPIPPVDTVLTVYYLDNSTGALTLVADRMRIFYIPDRIE